MLAVAGTNALVDGLAAVITHVSLHSGDPSTTGANELTGGSPAYARKAIAWSAAASGQRSNSGAVTFDVPAGATVGYVGFWSALTAGTFYGYSGLGNFSPFTANAAAATDTLTSFAHGLTNGQQAVIADVQTAGVPSGLVEGTIYFVVSAATDTFQLSATSGGAAINFTTDAEIVVQRCLPEVFAAQGQLAVGVAALVLDGRFI